MTKRNYLGQHDHDTSLAGDKDCDTVVSITASGALKVSLAMVWSDPAQTSCMQRAGRRRQPRSHRRQVRAATARGGRDLWRDVVRSRQHHGTTGDALAGLRNQARRAQQRVRRSRSRARAVRRLSGRQRQGQSARIQRARRQQLWTCARCATSVQRAQHLACMAACSRSRFSASRTARAGEKTGDQFPINPSLRVYFGVSC
jgi:hypothetical protein